MPTARIGKWCVYFGRSLELVAKPCLENKVIFRTEDNAANTIRYKAEEKYSIRFFP